MDLSIVIVNWNCHRYTAECIASIHQNPLTADYEIVVVDNASTDGSAQVLREAYPQIRLIVSEENIGFARANNLGLQHCSGTYVLFLNPDTVILSDALDEMYRYISSSDAIGALGCKLLNDDRTVQASCIQRFPTILGEALDSDFLRQRFPGSRMWGTAPLFDPAGNDGVEVEMISGACIMAPLAVLRLLGGFSSDYFMYGEDMDLCYRIRQLGRKVCYLGRAQIVHYGGKSTKQREAESFSVIVMRQSVFTFLVKTRGRLYAWGYRMFLALSALGRLAILGIASVLPGVDRVSARYSSRKWINILRWAMGLESADSRVNSGTTRQVVAKI